MKKRLLICLSLFGIYSGASAQSILTEDFNTMTTGNFATVAITYATTTTAQGGWTLNSHLQAPDDSFFQVENSSGTNRLALTGSPTAPGSPYSGSNYAQKAINWAGRTPGNDVVYSECIFNTGATSTSKNEFSFGIYNSTRSKCLGGFVYVRDTKLLKALAYDSTGASAYGNYSYSSIGSGGTQLILTDNTDYLFIVGYNTTTGKTYWYVAAASTPGTFLCNAAKQNAVALADVGLVVTAARAGTSNASSSTAYYDNIGVEARPCFQGTIQSNAEFSYSNGIHCLGGEDLVPTFVVPTNTGSFTVTPTGLTIDPSTGVVDMTNSTAGDYAIQYVTNNPGECVDSTTVSITLTESVTPTFTINDLICEGGEVPVLPLTSDNSITGTWSPSEVSNTTTGLYTFTASSGTCVEDFEFTITVEDCAGVEELTSNQFEVYPNPATQFATVQINQVLQNEKIELFAVDGSLITSRTVSGANKIQFDFQNIPSGLYYVKYAENVKILIKP